MKIYVLLLMFVLLNNSDQSSSTLPPKSCATDTAFKELIALLVARDYDELVDHFSFPIDGNSINALIEFNTLDTSFSINDPFTKKDLQEHMANIIADDFVAGCRSININDFWTTGNYQSHTLPIYDKEQNITQAYYLSVTKETANEIRFLLYYEFYEEGNTYESTIDYTAIFEDCRFVIKKIVLAG